MPTYQYTCTECSTPLEVVQSFSDSALTTCPTCGGRLRKVFSAVGVVFKGSGFYRTDSREGAKSGSASAEAGSGADGTAATAAGGGSGASGPDGKGTADKAAAKPAASGAGAGPRADSAPKADSGSPTNSRAKKPASAPSSGSTAA